MRVGGWFFAPSLSFSLYPLAVVVCILAAYFSAADGCFAFGFSIYSAFYPLKKKKIPFSNKTRILGKLSFRFYYKKLIP